MKRLSKLILLALFSFLLLSCGEKQYVSPEETEIALSKYLLEKYGEEFETRNLGIREMDRMEYYIADVFLARYLGTKKARDSYLHGKGNV